MLESEGCGQGLVWLLCILASSTLSGGIAPAASFCTSFLLTIFSLILIFFFFFLEWETQEKREMEFSCKIWSLIIKYYAKRVRFSSTNRFRINDAWECWNGIRPFYKQIIIVNRRHDVLKISFFFFFNLEIPYHSDVLK